MSGTVVWTNNANATLASPVTTGATTFTVTSGEGALFPNPTSGQFFPVTLISAVNNTVLEICYCTSRSGDVLTVERAQEGTTATAFNANDIASHQITAGTIPAPAAAAVPHGQQTFAIVGTYV